MATTLRFIELKCKVEEADALAFDPKTGAFYTKPYPKFGPPLASNAKAEREIAALREETADKAPLYLTIPVQIVACAFFALMCVGAALLVLVVGCVEIVERVVTVERGATC